MVFLVVLSDLSQIYKNEIKENFDELSKTEKFSGKKVLWILYDALDPEFLEKKIDNKKIYENFNALKNNGVYFENAFSPGKFTHDSAPAQLMGINIRDSKSKQRIKVFTNLEGIKIPFQFETTIFNDLKRKGLNVSLMSSVLEYCSSYLRSNKWKNCKDTISDNNEIIIFQDSLKFFFSIYFKLTNFLKLSEKKISKGGTIKEFIEFKNLDFERIKNLKLNNSTFYSDHANIINVDNTVSELRETDMLFLHVYNPHTHPNKEFLYKNLNIEKRIQENIDQASSEDNYFLRYLYSDIFTKKIIEEINKNYIDDVLLIISSDHWWRSKKQSVDKNYIGNSFFLIKNLNDDSNYLVTKKSTTIIIPKIINEFFKKSKFTNRDIYNFSNNLDIKIHIKTND